MPESLWPVEESATTRAPPSAASSGHSRLASAKWPRWLVANCASQPGPTRVSGAAMIAALLMRTSTPRPPSSMRCAKPCTLSRSPRSSSATSTRSMPARTSAACAERRAGTTTGAPAPLSARAVSSPTPEWPPVTTASRPLRSTPASTSAAVLRAPKPEPIGCWGVVMASAYEAEAVRDGGRLRAAPDVELGQDARDVHARGLLRHVELGADLAVRRAARDEGEHLPLARREPERVRAVRLGLRRRSRSRGVRQREPRPAGQPLGLGAQPGRPELLSRREHLRDLGRRGLPLAELDARLGAAELGDRRGVGARELTPRSGGPPRR